MPFLSHMKLRILHFPKNQLVNSAIKFSLHNCPTSGCSFCFRLIMWSVQNFSHLISVPDFKLNHSYFLSFHFFLNAGPSCLVLFIFITTLISISTVRWSLIVSYQFDSFLTGWYGCVCLWPYSCLFWLELVISKFTTNGQHYSVTHNRWEDLVRDLITMATSLAVNTL